MNCITLNKIEYCGENVGKIWGKFLYLFVQNSLIWQVSNIE